MTCDPPARRSTAWLLAVQERERRLLAQAVHDDIGQYLTGIRTQLLLLRCMAGDGQPALARLERYCQGLDDSFRALLRGLPPPACNASRWTRRCAPAWRTGRKARASPASCAWAVRCRPWMRRPGPISTACCRRR
ncbi:histidine kinase dimerization/phosphoacceptor domain-containing protein [Pseudomonas aeruginosa]|nr:histidine kinase dimerization/phosphoacceptor domain-containing protein [Pseudomonas aeruginosa]